MIGLNIQPVYYTRIKQLTTMQSIYAGYQLHYKRKNIREYYAQRNYYYLINSPYTCSSLFIHINLLQVHTIQRKFNTNDSWTENCAIAVRAASDVFFVYGCGTPQNWIIRRLNCDAETAYLQVYYRWDSYEISLSKTAAMILPLNIISKLRHKWCYILGENTWRKNYLPFQST